MQEVFETRMSSKGQVVISKEIRDRLGLSERQRFIEKVENQKIILMPIKKISELGGVLKGMEKKPTKEVIKEIKKGWD